MKTKAWKTAPISPTCDPSGCGVGNPPMSSQTRPAKTIMPEPSEVTESDMKQVREQLRKVDQPPQKVVATASCRNCLFWRSEECHRFPPMGAVWPITEPTSWCGEWKTAR